MRYNQFSSLLLEYSRQITAEKLGPALVKAATKDSTFVQSPGAAAAQSLMQDPERMQQFIRTVLEKIEQQDPTPNKEYTPWLARMYANGSVKIEDMNRNNVLGAFHQGKRRKMIKPEHADINRFKTFTQFEDAIISYDLDTLLNRSKEVAKGNANEVYKDAVVRIVAPEDQAAACYYGQGTKWCTAAKENNMFNTYASDGQLYILIPVSPAYPGEKYQLHFETRSFMNEKDNPVDLHWLLTTRFPSVYNYFNQIAPLDTMLDMLSDQSIMVLMNGIRIVIEDVIQEFMQGEKSDPMIDKGIDKILSSTLIDPSEVREDIFSEAYAEEGDYITVDEFPKLVADHLVADHLDAGTLYRYGQEFMPLLDEIIPAIEQLSVKKTKNGWQIDTSR